MPWVDRSLLRGCSTAHQQPAPAAGSRGLCRGLSTHRGAGALLPAWWPVSPRLWAGEPGYAAETLMARSAPSPVFQFPSYRQRC